MGKCSQCDERFILPIPCPEKLLEWAASASWRRLTRFVNLSGARGHSQDTIDQFVEVFTQRRWSEENAVHREMSKTGKALTHRERAWQKSELKLRRKSILDEMRSFTPREFDRLIVDIFESQGMTAQLVSGSANEGFDVKIWGTDGEFWGIAQCNRYAESNKIGASRIRDFAGAFMLSGATKGFYFTTSSYTRTAKRTARGFPWLTVYDGFSFVKYIEDIKFEIEKWTHQTV